MAWVLLLSCVALLALLVVQHRRVAALDARLAELPATMAQTTAAQVAEATTRAAAVAGEQLAVQAQAGAERVAGHERLVGSAVEAVRTDLERLHGLLADAERRRAGQDGQLGQQLTALAAATGQLGRTTEGLDALLRAPTRRGQWGERLVDELLSAAGLVEGVSYVRQESGPQGRPDVTFLLPDDRVLHLDVKFPMDAWIRHIEASDDQAAARHLATFVSDIRRRVRELGGRGYDRDPRSVDVVLLFAPNEQVFADALRAAPDLLDEALAARVVLCSPTSLFAMLAIVREAMDLAAMEQRSGEVLRLLAGVRDQWDRVCQQVDKVERALGTAGKAVEELAGPRRRRMDSALDAVDAAREAALPSTARDDEHPLPSALLQLPRQAG